MSKTLRKEERGWIETIYGDYWSVRKKLIIAGFFVPMMFSILLLFLMDSISSIFGFPFEPWIHFQGIITHVGLGIILEFSLLLIVISLLFRYTGERLVKLFHGPLDLIYKEIYIDKKPNQFGILEKNFIITILRSVRRFLVFAFVLTIYGILYIPSLIIGYFSYLLLIVGTVPNLSLIIKYVPFVGEGAASSIDSMFTSMTNISNPSWFNTTTAIILITAILASMLLVFGFIDLVDSNTNIRYRGNGGNVLINGLKTTIGDLHFPNKIANLAYTTILCLFTDQKTTSLNIPIINPKNIEGAIQNAMGSTQECYIARLPFDIKRIREILEKCPQEFMDEIKKEYGKIGERVKTFATSYGRRSYTPRTVTQMANVSIIYGLNSDGVKAYALVLKQPPNYSSRLIQTLWCSDPVVKDRIVHELRTLEWTKGV
jgi:hypothetical protein